MGRFHRPQSCPLDSPDPDPARRRSRGDGSSSARICKRPVVGVRVVVAVHHTPGLAGRPFDVGLAEPADFAASSAAVPRPQRTLDVACCNGDRLCRRTSCPHGRGIRLRRIRRPDCGWRLLELVCVALGAESLGAMASLNRICWVCRRHLGGVLRSRTHNRLSAMGGGSLCVCRRPDPVHLPRQAPNEIKRRDRRGADPASEWRGYAAAVNRAG